MEPGASAGKARLGGDDSAVWGWKLPSCSFTHISLQRAAVAKMGRRGTWAIVLPQASILTRCLGREREGKKRGRLRS